MFSKCLAFAFYAAVVDAAAPWNYDRCDVIGPAFWKNIDQCGGVQQSPIDLCGAQPFPPPGKRSEGLKKNYTFIHNNYAAKQVVTLLNTGHTLEVSVAALVPTLQIPALHLLVGRGQPDSLVSPVWQFAQMHLHFGREGNPNEGSEHAMDGRRYPAEAHLVHFNTARGVNLKQALGSGAKDAVLVVGVFLDLAEVESTLINVIANYAPSLQPPPQNAEVNSTTRVMLSDLFNPADAFYSYAGSLTTPGCFEQVTWVVMKTPMPITPDSLDLLKQTRENGTETISLLGNFRPLQPVGDRTVYLSKNATVPSHCAAVPVPDPCYDCTATPVLHSVQTTGNSEEVAACTGTPAWVWIAIGVSIPSAIMVTAAAVVFYFSWRKTHHAEKVAMAYSPFQAGAISVPNTAVTDAEWIK